MGHRLYYLRKKKGDKYIYYRSDNKKEIKDENILNYIKSIYIAPAYKDVHISPYSNDKILAWGYDDKGRKQYIYNKKWIKTRDKKKYEHMYEFGKKVHKINSDIKKALTISEFIPSKLIALVLTIINTCYFRIGNDVYKEEYGTHGVSTITKKELLFSGSGSNEKLKIKFIGKKGVNNECIIKNKEIITLMKELASNKNNNQKIFSTKVNVKTPEYGRINKYYEVTAQDVNDFLKNYGNFTTKNFRTWNANILFIKEIMTILHNKKLDPEKNSNRKKSIRELKGEIKIAFECVADKLHHTPTICKKSYVDSNLVTMYIDHPNLFKKIIINNYIPKKNIKAEENSYMAYLSYYMNKNNNK